MESISKKVLPLVGAFKDGIAILKLDKNKMVQVASNKSATVWGIVILAIPFVLNFLISMLQTTAFLGLQFKILLVPFLTTVLAIYVFSLVAQIIFHAKTDHLGFFRILSYASVAMWATVIPFIFGLLGILDVYSFFNLLMLAAGIWMVVVVYTVLMSYYKLTQQNAVITIIVGIIIMAIVQSILGRFLIGPFYSMVY